MKMKLFFTLLPVLALLAIPVRAQDGLAAKARAILAENCFDAMARTAQRKQNFVWTYGGSRRDLGGYRSVMPGSRPERIDRPPRHKRRRRTHAADENRKSLSQKEIGVPTMDRGRRRISGALVLCPIRPPALPGSKNRKEF